MKLVRKILDTIKPHFKKGGKLEKLYPAYDAFETMAFVPAHTTENGVHLRDAIDLKRTMATVIIALIPALIFGMWNVGFPHPPEIHHHQHLDPASLIGAVGPIF